MTNLANEFKGLPIEDLISAPLIAAATAQGRLAATTADFIQNVGMDSQSNIRNVTFKYNTTDTTGTSTEAQIDVPLLAIVNIPNLAVKKANVNFSMEVKEQAMDTSSVTTNTNLNVSSKWWSPVSVSISGSISTKSEHTRNTDKSAKYDIAVEARDDGMPEGLSRVLNILSQTITHPVDKTKTANQH